MSQEPILRTDSLVTKFYTYAGVVEALDGVNIYIKQGEILGLVGETGCGKSVTSLSILRLVPPPGKIEGGKVLLNTQGKEENIMAMSANALRNMRGKDISMIFQEPRAFLNPVYRVEDQISEVILVHRKDEFLKRALNTIGKGAKVSEPKSKGTAKEGKPASTPKRGGSRLEARVYRRMLEDMRRSAEADKVKSRLRRGLYRARNWFGSKGTGFLARFSRQRRLKIEVNKEVVKLLDDVEIADPERVAGMYPFELSGGMAQRVVIAMALACNPMLLIADEPTTNLDVTVQAQILHLIRMLQKNFESSILYITHDLGVVAEVCDRVAVMYAGNVVESAEVHELFKEPLHPYTKALLESIPRPGVDFKSIPGVVPGLINPPKGCRFNDRCPFAKEACRRTKPAFVEVKDNHFVMCHLYGGS